MYRCMKTACHEICHVLFMTHCPYYECLMNGSNLVNEADKKPFALCPVCLRKLTKYLNIQFKVATRYLSLIDTIKQSNISVFERELELYNKICADL